VVPNSRFVRFDAVPRYYFNLSCDGFEATDTVGECCRDDVAALHGALRAASAVLHKRLLADELSQSGWIEVEDERHRPVLRLPLRAASY
jgi:Domain of unknown function (DUF6894)